MRIILILVGAAVVAYLIIKGARQVMAERRQPKGPAQLPDEGGRDER
ncbi:hypothetical protein [Alcaligenes sp. SDU_A2]|nr:hypothetical protein [Alcaligenes sp.]HRL26915.1 hypothetical protein [Alcaligenes sp.]